MTVPLLALIGFALFIIHEFEEIIRFLPWIRARKNDPSGKQSMIMRDPSAYPSTETIAIMILEEAILALVVLGVAVWLNSYEIVLAVIIANTLHLFGHIADAISTKRWVPGSITALVTALLNIAAIVWVFLVAPISLWLLATITIVVGILLVANLAFLHNKAAAIEIWRRKHED